MLRFLNFANFKLYLYFDWGSPSILERAFSKLKDCSPIGNK